jgi:serine protease AprX
MPHAAKVVRLLAALMVLTAFGATGPRLLAAPPAAHLKLDPVLQQRASTGAGQSRVIIRLAKAVSRGATKTLVHQLGGTTGRELPIINAQAASVPNRALIALASSPLVARISADRAVAGAMERTAAVIGAASVRQELGLDGAGIGVAIVDSGITSWHDDLTGAPDRAQRVDRFIDFVGERDAAYDDYGHGTHVAGIVAGNGLDSNGARAGIAPGARLTVLKVLDQAGRGHISDVIAALDYIVANKDVLNIRVANLSITAPVYESYDIDPLTVAAKRAVSAGIVVVAAAGNSGRSETGATVYGAVGAPGNAPWVLTVGASSHMGTIDRADDTIAAFSSRGPAMGGHAAKPDLVAPGVGLESLSDPLSALYTSRAAFLLSGTTATAYLPYLSLSGTSMAAPVVSGTVALMVQANPALTPNQIKAILQYTSEPHPGYDTLTQGAGFVNAQGAVELARYFADPSSGPFPSDAKWGGRLIWGNHLVQGGRLRSDANAWSTSVAWGAATTPDGQTIQWGVIESADSLETTATITERPWSASDISDNVVWGMQCGGDDCEVPWDGQAVLATNFDTVVWGMNQFGDTVVWGMNEYGNTVVWGMSCSTTNCEPVIWSTR